MADTPALATVRRMILAALAVGLVGSLTELVLLGHDEDSWQIVPLVVMTLSVVAVVWHAVSPNRASLVVLRSAMVLLMLSGATGTILHYRGNMEFQLEMEPSRRGWDLFVAVLQAKSPPSLAPGNLALLGALGLIATWRLR